MRWLSLVMLIEAGAANAGSIHGRVIDTTGLPLADVTVSLSDSFSSVQTDSEGRFAIETPAATRGVLAVTLQGFQAQTVAFAGASVDDITVELALAPRTERIEVIARLEDAGAEHVFETTPLEVVRTPGTQADLFRALQTLPGVTRVDEGDGLFVRGGDVSETLVLLDGTTVNHPYRYETPTGGFRGAVEPFLIDGLAFSTGGFSARYGNILSAVVDMRSLSRPEAREVDATLGLAGASAQVAQPFGQAAGVRLAANLALPELLFAVNKGGGRFDPYPTGWDVSANAVCHARRLGVFKFLALAQADRVGVTLERDAFVGRLRSGTRHALVAGHWDGMITSNWAIATALGVDSYRRSASGGVLDSTAEDRHATLRVDLQGPAFLRGVLRTGVDAQSGTTEIHGQVPARGGDFGGLSGVAEFSVDQADQHAGAYMEWERRVGRLTPILGLRIDRFGLAHSTTLDPRANVYVDLGRSQRLRLAGGQYHQAPSASYYDEQRGARRLPPMVATHLVLGYEYGRPEGSAYLRVEGYHKDYRHLPVEDQRNGFSSAGVGSASGVDVFTRRRWSRLTLHASASCLAARRRATPIDQYARYSVPDKPWPPDFAIPLSGQVVAEWAVASFVSVAASYRSAVGRPITPIVGASATATGLVPVFGPINSERLPRYERVDLSMSHLRPCGRHGLLVLFASVDNLLGRANVLDYAYSTDYSQKRPVVSTMPRTFYVGFSVRWSPK